MGEAKSYKLQLSRAERLLQFLVGQLEWRELWSTEPVTIEQAKISKIHPSTSQDAVSIAFVENDHKRIVSFKKSNCAEVLSENPALMASTNRKDRLQYFLEAHLFAVPVFIVFYFPVLSIYFFSWGSKLFLNNSCDRACSESISLILIPFISVFLFLMAPVVFFFLRKFILMKTKKFFIPRAQVLMWVSAIFLSVPLLYWSISRPNSKQIVALWQQGKLNQQSLHAVHRGDYNDITDRLPSSRYFNNKKTE